MSLTIDVPVSLDQSYRLTVGRNLWDSFREFCADNYSPQKLIVLMDENVHRLHGQKVQVESEPYFRQIEVHTIPQGEKSKSVGMWNNLVDKLLNNGVERRTPLLAVGGGVTGDLAGFTAASVLRGIPLIHMPTSLLAMVDSSIGGKTGVNHGTGKNLIGAFYQPDAVFTDIDYLATLAGEEWINGLSEILKYAAISEPDLIEDITKSLSTGFEPCRDWEDLIAAAASVKIDIVSRDTLESGVRAFLNFGHTFGHALEKNAGYGTISHGEAVFIGMLAALKASSLTGSKLDTDFFDPFIDLYNISSDVTSLDIEALIETMRHDKKVQDGTIRLILLEEWGSPCIKACRDYELLQEAWNYAFKRINTVNTN